MTPLVGYCFPEVQVIAPPWRMGACQPNRALVCALANEAGLGVPQMAGPIRTFRFGPKSELSDSWRRNRTTIDVSSVKRWAATSRKNALPTCKYACAFSKTFRSNILSDFIHPNRSVQAKVCDSGGCLPASFDAGTVKGWCEMSWAKPPGTRMTLAGTYVVHFYDSLPPID